MIQVNAGLANKPYRASEPAVLSPMDHDHSEHEQPQPRGERYFHWVLCGFILVAAFFLITEHRAHLFGFLPYALLLACPLMHFFGGHGHHSHRHPDADKEDRS